MFARQIAVMKGQAWNVVETLKTPDHGPLELTRRTRVCVWDDVVDIPVALPMRPSTEIRRIHAEQRQRQGIAEEEEMDISAAHASAPPVQHDLLGLSSSDIGAAQVNRFNISRQNSANDVRPSEDSNGALSPSSVQDFTFDSGKESRFVSNRPLPARSKTRLSYEEPRRLFDNLGERRRFSFGISRKLPSLSDDGDDLEGDLGYAAAEDQEMNRRKVIVERLETVKSRNPVFTWC